MTDTKESLLRYFSGLDIAVLQRLKKYSELLIIPDEDLLTNATMQQMVDKAHSIADVVFPEWTDRSKSDFGQFLVELIALFSEKDFWYINAHANESILSKMRLYSNVFSRAISMGYSPETCRGAKGHFKVTFSSGDKVTYERGDLVVLVEGKKYSNDVSFMIEESLVPTTQTLELNEGTQLSESVSFNGNNIFIRKPNVDLSSVEVAIDNISFTRVGTFGLSAKDSTHFTAYPEEDGSCSIYFGRDGLGYTPPLGKTIKVSYRSCSGADGNSRITADVSIQDSLDRRKAIQVIMLSDTSGGVYGESITSIREKAPLYFRTKKAAINKSTAEELLNGLRSVLKSCVEVSGNDIIFHIIPRSGYLEPTKIELKDIMDEFSPYVILGYSAVYQPNNYKSLVLSSNPQAEKIVLDVIVSKGYDVGVVTQKLQQLMLDLTSPLMYSEYGGSFEKTRVEILARTRVEGVQSVSFRVKVGYAEEVMNDVQLLPNEIFRPIMVEQLIIRTNVI